MSKGAYQTLGREQLSIQGAQASPRSTLTQVTIELVVIAVPAAIIIAGLSAMLASGHLLLGYYGDQEHFVWHADTLKQVLGGDAIVTRASFGVPHPYAYNQLGLLIAIPTMFVSEISGNPIFTANFMTLALLALNFCSMYAVLRLLNVGVPIAVVFGTVFLCAPVTLVHALGHHSLMATFLLPLYLLVVYEIKRHPRSIRLWLAGGVIAGGYVWVREELGLFILAVSFILLALNAREALRQRLTLRVGLSLMVVALFVLPVMALYIHRWDFDRDHGIETSRRVEDATPLSASPANYLFPSDESFAYKNLPLVFEHANLVEHLNYLGILNLVGLTAWMFMLLFRRDLLDGLMRAAPFLRELKWELGLIAAVSLVLSLGPVLELNDATVKLPLHWGYDINLPVVEQMRAWGRFGIFAFAVATLLSAHVFRFLLQRHGVNGGLLALLAVPAVMFVVTDQYPVDTVVHHKLAVPTAAVREIEATEGDFFVLHVPFGVYSGPTHNSTALFLQMYHGKPIVNGYGAFLNPLYETKVVNSPMVCLNYPQMLNRATERLCSATLVGWFFQDEDIRYIIYEKETQSYHPGFDEKTDSELREESKGILDELTDAGVLEQFYEDGAYVFYRRASIPAMLE